MTYSGSTQNSSYSKRTYNKKLSTDLADYAKALDKQRKEQVKGFQQASKDQLGELDRQDGIAASNDKFQIAQLSKFSDTLNDFLDTTVKTVGKAYIDNKREEGVELYRRYLAGDKEAIAEVEANAEQLKDIDAEKLVQLGKGIAGVGVGIAAFGAGAVVGVLAVLWKVLVISLVSKALLIE